MTTAGTMMPNQDQGESIPSLLRAGGQWSLVCNEVVVMDKVLFTHLGEPPGAELSLFGRIVALAGSHARRYYAP